MIISLYILTHSQRKSRGTKNSKFFRCTHETTAGVDFVSCRQQIRQATRNMTITSARDGGKRGGSGIAGAFADDEIRRVIQKLQNARRHHRHGKPQKLRQDRAVYHVNGRAQTPFVHSVHSSFRLLTSLYYHICKRSQAQCARRKNFVKKSQKGVPKRG